LTRSAAQILVDQLVIHGVDTAFCVPGESYIAVLNAIGDTGIRLYTARHEAGAANMADACVAWYGAASPTSASSSWASSGSAITTGPGRPDAAVWNARAISSGIAAASSAVATSFAISPNMRE
jgi:glyoxylate carboligase